MEIKASLLRLLVVGLKLCGKFCQSQEVSLSQSLWMKIYKYLINQLPIKSEDAIILWGWMLI